MSQTPPQLEGQIDAPNPMELFWEKNKLLINAVLIAAVLAIGVNYLLRYLDQQKINAQWGGLAVTSGMDGIYADGGSQKSFLEIAQLNPQMMQMLIPAYYASAQSELVSRLPQSLRDADEGELEAFLVSEAKGTAAEPLTRWALAYRAIENQEWDRASAQLDALQKDFPDHFLCGESAYPIQWRDEVETEQDPDKGEDKSPGLPQNPELLPARVGSAIAAARARIASEQQFRADHPNLYQAPEPDFAQAVVFGFGAMGEVKIGFFNDRASLHRDAFIRLAGEGFWVGQRIHQVVRQPEGQIDDRPEEVSFGLVSSKEDSITGWQDDEDLADEANAIPWENSSLSHFPFMVAAEPHTEGRSQIQRLVININDSAIRDGSRVIFGRVIEGMEVMQEILGTELSTESEETSGRGRPVDFITIESVTVVTR